MEKNAFVIMPFEKPFNSYYKSIYKPALESLGYDVRRVDELPGSRLIPIDIVNSIREADLILCDISTRNPNVFYELGFAHALGKPVILITKDDKTDIPFDVNQIRVNFYNTDDVDWGNILRENIIEFAKKSNTIDLPEYNSQSNYNLRDWGVGDIGITKVFGNFEASSTEIEEQIKTSNTIRIFLQLGKTFMFKTDVYTAIEKYAKNGANVKILHAGKTNPYLTRRIALERGSRFEKWQADIGNAIQYIDILSEGSNAHIRGRQHNESYLWLIFLFDKYAYIQPYLYDKHNTKYAPVIKVSKNSIDDSENKNSLYHIFSKYFDLKWDECRPDKTTLKEIIDPTTSGKIAVAVNLRVGDKRLFVIPKRYIKESNSVIKFHSPGGKKELGEDWIDAVVREVTEEIRVDQDQLKIIPSKLTRYFTSTANLSSIEIGDSPRPYCIYKRTKIDDTTLQEEIAPDQEKKSTKSPILWLVGYNAEISNADLKKIAPTREVGCILLLTDTMLKKTLSKIKIRDIFLANDGSRIIAQDDIDINKYAHFQLMPSGLASIIATEESI